MEEITLFLPFTHETGAFLECPVSPPLSVWGSVLCYLEIWNDGWKVKTCITVNSQTKKTVLFFGILKWHLTLTWKLLPWYFFLILRPFPFWRFSFFGSQGINVTTGYTDMVWLILDQGAEPRNSWGKELHQLFPDLAIILFCSSSIACPGLHCFTLQM